MSSSKLFRSFHSCTFFILLACIYRVHCTVTAQQLKTKSLVTWLPAPSIPPAQYSGVQAFNPTTLNPPPVPTPTIQTTINVPLQNGGGGGLGVQQTGNFMGFSVEMSVVNQVLGKNSTHIQVPFLNLMANIQARSGSGVRIRVGGNTQEAAKLVASGSLPNNSILLKNNDAATGTTNTPPLQFTPDLIYMMANISNFVDVRWIMGLPWFQTHPFDLGIVPAATTILGDNLIGLQAGNEPDMYVLHGHRNASYGPFDYYGETSDLLTDMTAAGVDPTGRAQHLLISPNIANFAWTPEQVWNTGYVDQYHDNLAFLAVEKYPTDNCGAALHNGETPINPQDVIANFLNHDGLRVLVKPYLNSTLFAQSKGKPFLMMETNSASCGGFVGISDVFAGALWGLDWALQMAHSNFSGAMFHTTGVSVFYNAFSPPPTKDAKIHQWSIGPIYYSALVMSEVIGPSNVTQVLDLTPTLFNGTPNAGFSYGVPNTAPGSSPNGQFTPIYGIFENGVPVRVAAFNYVNDPSGASDVNVVVSLSGGNVPSQVKVKYLSASSVSQKGGYTWANQTFGGFFESDGRLTGNEDIQTVSCDANGNTCTVKVPAPSFALIFLNDAVYSASGDGGKDAPMTFSTTTLAKPTRTYNTATVDPSVLATSNGHKAAGEVGVDGLARTSRNESAAWSMYPGMREIFTGVLASVVIGWVAVLGW